jgi:hypothetical protein
MLHFPTFQAISPSLILGVNTNIGRRKFQPFELIERIEPFERHKPHKRLILYLTSVIF